MVKIKWVNHASYVLEYGSLKLITDPWIEGRVFNRSWEHLAHSVFTYDDFRDITHIWFSHEHPDHFFPPNLSKIPEAYRKRITVLFQYTVDHKVADFCRKMHFGQVLEMQPFQPYTLVDGVTVVNATVSNDTDSWLYLKTDTCSLLNLNDCVFKTDGELQKVKQAIGTVDVLFTQFSYANWVGNRTDDAAKSRQAERKKQEIAKQLTAIQPKYAVPFASHVWFCHADNFHMNAQANTVAHIEPYIQSLGSRCVVMYPGQEWVYGQPHDNTEAIQNYTRDIQSLPERPLTVFDSIPREKLHESAQKNRERCLHKNNRAKLLGYPAMRVHLTDYGQVFSYSYKNGLEEAAAVTPDEADISLHSQGFSYCLDHDWGYDTLLVAGTFEKPPKGDFSRFMEYQWIANLNNKGESMPGLFRRLLNKLMT